MIVELIRPDDPRWEGVLRQVRHDVYHLPGYGGVYARLAPGEPRALYVRGEAGELLLPLLLRALPDIPNEPSLEGWRDACSPYGYPTPLVVGELSEPERARFGDVVKEALAEAQVLSCFVRGHPLLPWAAELALGLGTVEATGESVHYDLRRSEEELWGEYRPNFRRLVRRATDAGYQAVVNDWSYLDDFIDVYAETMSRVGAAPFYHFDARYFAELKETLGEKLHLLVVLNPARKVAAATLVTTCHGIAQGHLFGTRGTEMQSGASVFGYDAVRRWTKARGELQLNVGGGVGGVRDRLFHFKIGFSRTTAPFQTLRVVCEPGRYALACEAVGVSASERLGFFPPYRRAQAPLRAAG